MQLIFRNSVLAIGAVLSLASGFAHGAEPSTPMSLTAAQLISVVVGNTIRYQNDDKDVVNEYYAPDGTVRGSSKRGGKYTGAWQIRFGNYFCIVAPDPTDSGCIRVFMKGDKIEFHLDIGAVEGPFEFRKGNPENL